MSGLVHHAFMDAGPDVARRDGVYADAVGAETRRHIARHLGDTGLRGAIGADRGRAAADEVAL